MPVITLTSDYGLTDYRVASIKGKILSLKEDAVIVDITHQIEAYNLLQTAYIVRNAYPHFPKGSIHIIAVDSFFSKQRKFVLYKADEHYFMAADNGVLSLIFYNQKPEMVYEITLNNRFDDVVNFSATDIFAPAAVHLYNGGLPEVIGRKFKNPVQTTFIQPVFNSSEKIIVGEVMYIDNFGNIVSNISQVFYEKIKANFEKFTILFRNISLHHIYQSYTGFIDDWTNEREYHGKSTALFNEVGLLEIAIYKGSLNNGAKSLFGLSPGEKIYIEFE